SRCHGVVEAGAGPTTPPGSTTSTHHSSVQATPGSTWMSQVSTGAVGSLRSSVAPGAWTVASTPSCDQPSTPTAVSVAGSGSRPSPVFTRSIEAKSAASVTRTSPATAPAVADVTTM